MMYTEKHILVNNGLNMGLLLQTFVEKTIYKVKTH